VVQAAIGIEPRESISIRAVERAEPATHQDFSVGLQSD